VGRHCPRTLRRTQRWGGQFSSPDWIPNYLEPWPKEASGINLSRPGHENDTRIRPLSRGGNFAPRIYPYSYIYINVHIQGYIRIRQLLPPLVSEISTLLYSRHCALQLDQLHYRLPILQGLLLDTVLDILGPHPSAFFSGLETPGPFSPFYPLSVALLGIGDCCQSVESAFPLSCLPAFHRIYLLPHLTSHLA
jgi:hypothetical protein